MILLHWTELLPRWLRANPAPRPTLTLRQPRPCAIATNVCYSGFMQEPCQPYRENLQHNGFMPGERSDIPEFNKQMVARIVFRFGQPIRCLNWST